MRSLRSVLVVLGASAALAACVDLAAPPCLVGRSDSASAYLVQLRPRGELPGACPQGQQYQILFPSMYSPYERREPALVVLQLAGSTVDPPSGAQASGKFTSFLGPPGSDVCTIPELTPAVDDSATPVDAPTPVGSTTYTFSEMQVLSDAAHRGSQFEALAVVDYGIPECTGLQYVAQAVFPITPCLDDSICLPDPVPDQVPFPFGRGLGSQLARDYRAFCNLDPALLGNPEIASILGEFGAGPGLEDDDGNLHDVGVCFYSEPFPSLCPKGSMLSTTGPCVAGPGSNPH